MDVLSAVAAGAGGTTGKLDADAEDAAPRAAEPASSRTIQPGGSAFALAFVDGSRLKMLVALPGATGRSNRMATRIQSQ